MDSFVEIFKIAPQWATLFILGLIIYKQAESNKKDKLIGGGVTLEDIETIVKNRVEEVKVDLRELRAIVIKHIEKD